ncbi:hypothetical protein BJ508DRAFT_361531 [Ascobolus immersus RN42]|uniref:Cytochrome c oxidase assembly protein n=1 Tax=Ascobolus immersus RN42 TaxID=1160509 RepID=A0A3N4ICI0_ASCIM|nr:hypothetical protein BJ508DRAFT_361531 [Ascobolus immersus RN42]
MPSSCQDIRAALAECLQNSPCIMIQRNKPSDCLRPPLVDELPTRCQQLKKGYGQCKRGMVDMRKRFRGNMPVGMMGTEQEKDFREEGYQLYAGKNVVGGVKPTAGEEDLKEAASLEKK